MARFLLMTLTDLGACVVYQGVCKAIFLERFQGEKYQLLWVGAFVFFSLGAEINYIQLWFNYMFYTVTFRYVYWQVSSDTIYIMIQGDNTIYCNTKSKAIY